MILDSGDEVYIWIGNDASPEEKEKSFQFAKVNHFDFGKSNAWHLQIGNETNISNRKQKGQL